MGIFHRYLVLSILISLTGLNAESAENTPAKVLLYDFKEQKGVQSLSRLPSRIYLAYDETLKIWTYLLTDPKGNLATPSETLLAGSVVTASALGIVSPSPERYQLGVDGKWAPSDEPERLNFVIAAEVPVLKTVTLGSESNPGPSLSAPMHLPPTTKR